MTHYHVISIRSEGKAPIQFVGEDSRLYPCPYDSDDEKNIIDNLGLPLHLYIYDPDIKFNIGDWILDVDTKRVKIADEICVNVYKSVKGINCYYKKIVASTDPKLTEYNEGSGIVKNHLGAFFTVKKISDFFIRAFINNFNLELPVTTLSEDVMKGVVIGWTTESFESEFQKEFNLYWQREIEKCKKSPYYFATKYYTVNGQPFETSLSEAEFNKLFGHDIGRLHSEKQY